MNGERFNDFDPQSDFYSTVVDKALEKMRENPGNLPSFYIAQVLGQEASEGLKKLDKTFTERLGATPGPLYPGSREFEELTPEEKQDFLYYYLGVWAAASVKAWNYASKTYSFDFNLFGSFYEELVRGTCVVGIREGKRGVLPIDEEKTRSLLQYGTASSIFFDEGLALIPPLRTLLIHWDALPTIRGKITPLYSTFERDLELKLSHEPTSIAKVAEITQNKPIPGSDSNKVNFDEAKWIDMFKKTSSD